MLVSEIMSGRVCFVCGKGSLKGNWVSHANNKNTRRSYVNLRPFKMAIDGSVKVVKLCTKCLRIEKENVKKLQLSQKTEQVLSASRQLKTTPTFI